MQIIENLTKYGMTSYNLDSEKVNIQSYFIVHLF